MTTAQILTAIGYRLKDPSERTYTPAIKVDWSNAAQLDIVNRTECYTANNSAITITSGTAEYNLSDVDSDLLQILRMEWNGKRLEETSIEQLSIGDSNWRALGGTPTHYYLVAGDKFGLYPNSNETTSTKLSADYVKKPNDLSASSTSTSPVIPVNTHRLIVTYAVMLGLQEQGKYTEATQLFNMEYLPGITQFKGLYKERQRKMINTLNPLVSTYRDYEAD